MFLRIKCMFIDWGIPLDFHYPGGKQIYIKKMVTKKFN